jgi:hypothetical protein
MLTFEFDFTILVCETVGFAEGVEFNFDRVLEGTVCWSRGEKFSEP